MTREKLTKGIEIADGPHGIEIENILLEKSNPRE